MTTHSERAPADRAVDAVRLELVRLRAAIALIATRMDLSEADGRILVDLLTPPPRELEAPRPPG